MYNFVITYGDIFLDIVLHECSVIFGCLSCLCGWQMLVYPEVQNIELLMDGSFQSIHRNNLDSEAFRIHTLRLVNLRFDFWWS